MSRIVKASGIASVVMFASAAAIAAPLPLKPGTYVREGVACHGAPFAAQFDYKNEEFAYPHATHCVTKITEHHGNMYKTTQTCSALGDGTPATPSSSAQEYEIISPSRLSVKQTIDGHEDKSTFRLCKAVN